MHELEEGEIAGQLLLRDAAVRPQPGAQQRPNPFHRVHVDFAEAVTIFVTSILTPAVVNRLVAEAPLKQPAVDCILVCVDQAARGHAGQDQRLDRRLLNVGQQVEDHGAAALNHAEDRWLLLLQSAAARLAFQSAAPARPAFFATATG